jgi:polar amino acid transport system substrate-binding protein
VKELARRLGVRYEIYPAANAADIVKRLNEHQSDIGFMAFDAKRAKDVDFSNSYALMYNAFITRSDSTIAATSQVDKAGVKVAAVRGQTQQIVLSETVRNASMTVLEKKPSQQELEALLGSGQVDVYGANRHDAEQVAAQSGGKLKALPDNFLVVEQAIVTPRGESPKMVELNSFVDEVSHNGFVEQALVRTRISGLAVAHESKR